MAKKPTTKNPQDTTLRNNRARAKEISDLRYQLRAVQAQFDDKVTALHVRAALLEDRVTALEQRVTISLENPLIVHPPARKLKG